MKILSSPLPEKVSLEFLVYRWGLRSVAESQPDFFIRTLNEYLFELGPYGLEVNTYRPVAFYENNGSSEIMDRIYTDNDYDDAWIDFEAFKGVGAGLYDIKLKGDQIYIYSHLFSGTSDSKAFKGNRVTTHDVLDSYFLEIADELNGWAVFEEKKVQNGKRLFRAMPFIELSPKQIFINRESLKAFEQVTGFYNHGLEEKDLKEYKLYSADRQKFDERSLRGTANPDHVLNRRKKIAKGWKEAALEEYKELKGSDETFKSAFLFADAVTNKLNAQGLKNAHEHKLQTGSVQKFLRETLGENWYQ